MKSQILTVMTGAFAAFAVFAESETELVRESSRGRWTFSAGPSWRSRVKMETSGTVVAPRLQTGTTSGYLTDAQNPAEWGPVDTKPVPEKYYPMPDETAYSVDSIRRDVTTVAGSDYTLGQSDENAPLGLNLQVGYDLHQSETWAIGLNLRFAGYWNMRSSSAGLYNGGSRSTQLYRDSFLFMNGPYAWLGDPAPTPESGYLPEETADYSVKEGSLAVENFGSRAVTTRLRSDFYQIGLGPKITWTPFAGWCEWMDWLDVYGGVEVLCNIAYGKLEADGASGTSTDCRIGFGGNVGLVGNLTDWLGIYGQVGYEWVDKTSVSAGGFNADIDYSSLVLSAGVQFRF